ncbi:response regulator transcription factor [Piscinibacter sp. HJYY11]|uniref:response regulator transcription factor n=1 Tax=Piscinibacter sp. HJYY11 TaxID=2801333 RepID=UPI00191E9D9E|nr:response regulator [Piscinibacter sp. HJYY11]MBL0726426.1 response regulator [Piscinibacter sp. HJYY11]
MADRPIVAIVDDDKSIRHAISDLLKAAGFQALAFQDAESFLASPDRALVDCLVADMRMPGMSGLKLHEALAAAGQAIPTIIMTAHPEETTQVRVSAAGIQGYLVKPFVPDELLDCLAALLGKPGSGPIPKS